MVESNLHSEPAFHSGALDHDDFLLER